MLDINGRVLHHMVVAHTRGTVYLDTDDWAWLVAAGTDLPVDALVFSPETPVRFAAVFIAASTMSLLQFNSG